MPTTKSNIKIEGKTIIPKRLSLKGWSSLETVKKAIDEAVSKKDYDSLFLHLVQFVDMASSKNGKIDWSKVSWYEFINVYFQTVTINQPTIEFPVMYQSKTQKADSKMPWEYDGRAWYFWLNLFAKIYGWNESTIGELDIDTAIGLYQETLLDDQFEKEWQWSLSEIAFPYNSSTKKQEYKPLERPEWMLPLAPTTMPIIKIRADMIPVGNVLSVEDVERQMKYGK